MKSRSTDSKKARKFPLEKALLASIPLILAGCGSGGEGFLCQGLGANTVSGTVVYEKQMVDQDGFTNQNILLPVRFADVEVVGPKGVLTTATTDASGQFCAAYLPGATPTVNSVSIISRSDIPSQKIQVGFFFEDPLTGGIRFGRWAVSKSFNERDGNDFTVDFTIRANSLGGVFNILDTMSEGAAFVRRIKGEVPPLLTAVWQQEIGGTFFITEKDCQTIGSGVAGDCIFVQGDGLLFFDEPIGGDRDEYDDDILLHEYGHFITHNFSTDTSPGGIHFLNDHTQDIRLSWSEGWATFFSSAVRNNPVSVDVGIDGTALFSFSIESNSLLFPPVAPGLLENDAVYTTSEIAVASVLWDIFDGLNSAEPFDALSLGFQPIWDVLAWWRQSPPKQTTMEVFWDTFGQLQPQHLLSFLNITQERLMEFIADWCEISDACHEAFITKTDDNEFARATPIRIGDVQRHTLFPSGDVDYVSFTLEAGKSYAAETFGLYNGADTFLKIFYNKNGQETPLLASNGVPFENDNPSTTQTGEGCAQLRQDSSGNFTSNCPNNETALASKVVLSAFSPPADCLPSPCTLYARINRSMSAPSSTGRYGSYRFQVREITPP